MDKEEFERNIMEFFTHHQHAGVVNSLHFEEDFVDEGIRQLIARVETTVDSYWVIGNNEHGFVVYSETSGNTAEEIYSFHQEEMKNTEEEDDSILYGEENLSEDFIRAVGRLTINFAHLEFTLTLFCGSHMGVSHPINEIITSELSTKQLLNISSAIYQKIESDPPRLEQFHELIKTCFRLEESRNTVIHSYYGGSTEKLMIRQKSSAKARRGYKFHQQEITADEINILADEMKKVSKKFITIIYSNRTPFAE